MFERRLYINLIIFLVFTVVIVLPLFYFPKGVYPYSTPKTLFFQAMVELIAFLWLALLIRDVPRSPYAPRATPFLYGLLVFLFALFLTSVTGEDFWRSLWSTQERGWGAVAFLHAGLFALILASLYKEINWKALCYTSLSVSLFVELLAFIQLWIPNLLLGSERVGDRPGATFGNPSFLAGYILFHIFIALYFLLMSFESEGKEKRGEQIFLFAALMLETIALFLTQTRGDILGLAVGGLLLLVFFTVRPPTVRVRLFAERKFYVIALVLFLGLGVGFWFTRTSAVWSRIPGLGRFATISLDDQTLEPRLLALQAVWKGIEERPLLGWGWDNFNIVFNKFYDPRALESGYIETRFDKPHNFLAEYMVVGGALLTLGFFGLLFCFVYELWKLRETVFAHVFTAALAAYFVRSLFVFDTIGPLFILFFIFGMTDGKYFLRTAGESIPHASYEEGRPRTQESRRERRARLRVDRYAGGGRKSMMVACVLLSFFPVYYLSILPLKASNDAYWGFNYFLNGKPNRAIQSFKNGVATWSPYRWVFKRDYATAVAEAYFNNIDPVTKKSLIPDEEAWAAIHAMEEVAAEHPKDAYNHYALIDMYNQVSDLDADALLAAAEREAAVALRLSPRRQEVYFSLAKTKTLKGEYAEALRLTKEALDLNPNVPDAHFYYGLLAYANGDQKTGYVELRKTIDMGRPWKNAQEPRVVANYFADSGHIEETIELYKESLALKNDPETKIKLGIAYYFAGRRDLAKSYVKEIAAQFDLTKSPSYGDLEPILRDLGVRP